MINFVEKIKQNVKNPDLIEKVFEFAKTAHFGQKRFSGEDYLIHPIKVALILSQMGLDSKTVAAGILHDVADDTPVSLNEIEKKFGKEIAFLVEGVSKLGKLRYPKEPLEIKPIQNRVKKPIDLQAENLRKMFLAMAEDIRVVLIKLADRLHNMETLSYIPKEKQKRFALETLEIFVPLTDRLGMGQIKAKLEDLSFPYLYPKEYQWLTKNMKKERDEKEKCLKKIEPELRMVLEKEGIKPLDIQSRTKSYFSLYQKLLKYDMNFERIYDLVALRLIVEDIKSCYQSLGVLHKYWRPLPGRIKDYIAFPKPNGYQGLHTTIFCPEEHLTEVQIRTPQMHKEAEYGIFAHWAYKEGINLVFKRRKFAWVAQLRDWQKEISNSEEFFNDLRIDFFKNRIFVFTPKGDVIDLPEGACPVDFAYAVHTDLGNHCVGAKANGKIIALNQILKNGDVVEILVDKNKNPSHDWMKSVKTSLARHHIQKQTKGFLRNLKEKISPGRITKELFKKKEVLVVSPLKIKRSPTIAIGGETGIALSVAKCCNPQSGDKIKAYITKSKGASIHKENCEIFKKSGKHYPEKIILAFWKEK